MRQGDEIAGGEIDGIAVIDFAAGAALAEQVIDDHVGPVASEDRREHRGLGCQDTPGLRELAVQVDRRVDLDGAKHFGKRVHGRQSTTGLSADRSSSRDTRTRTPERTAVIVLRGGHDYDIRNR